MFCPETEQALQKALDALYEAREMQLWNEDATGSDKNEQHKIDPAIDQVALLLKNNA